MNKFRRVLFFFALFFTGIFCLRMILNDSYASAAEMININTAGVEELCMLPGIGEVKAQAIVDYRDLNGLFEVIEDIMNVSGIGAATFEKIKDSITVGEPQGSFCGDGKVDAGEEECDDGNNINNDGCDVNCRIEQGGESYLFGDIVINEFVSDPISGEDEWIELYSNFGETINLDGWTIEEGAGSVTNLSGEILPRGFFVIDDVVGNLNNSGDIIILKNSNGEIIDSVVYGDWDDGNVDDNAPKADDPDSISRLSDGADSDIDNVDFVVSDPTKGAANNIKNQNNLNQSGGAGKIPPTPLCERGACGAAKGSVVINEIVSDPEDGPEWVELYNKTSDEIDLSGWHIEEGSEARTFLEGKISGHGYLTVENLKGNLNNKGDIIFLFDDLGNVIDQVTYGDWDDGNVNDNAPKSSDPDGIGRIGLSQDTNNDSADFAVVSVLTSNTENILVNDQDEELEVSSFKNKIIINEIFPNPKGSDEGEFIEFKNIGDDEIDLSGFSVGDNSKRRYKIEDGIKIKSGGFFILKRIDSKIALNNTGGDRVVLYDARGNVVDEVDYKEKAIEDESYILLQKASDTQGGVGRLQAKWKWTDQPSMGLENIFVKENQSPVVVIDFDKSDVLVGEEIILDASDSYDPEGEDLILEWRVGDLLYHDRILNLQFDEAGSYEIKLTLSDGEKKTVETRLVNVLSRVGSATSLSLPSGGVPLGGNAPRRVPTLINEFLPNPEGSDDAEFIELFNSSDFEINLKNFYLDDGEGGSSPYHITDDIILQPYEYFVFERADTKLALNNTSDAVRLLDSNKNVLEQVDYFDVLEGASFSRAFDGNWFWTGVITKGFENQIIFADQFDSSAPGVGLEFSELELSQVREMELGDKIKTRGVVSVLPGFLGVQVFYVSKSPQPPFGKGGNIENTPPTPSAGGGKLEIPPNPPLEKGGISVGGIQIYSYKKDFPEMEIGDEVEVSGILSQSGGEHRLKISQKDDVRVLENIGDVEPVKIKAEEVEKELEGGFVSVEGEIVEIAGSSIFIDDGSGEVKVYLKQSSGVKKSDLKEGDIVSVAGIVSQTSSGFRLLPRSQDDIKKVDVLGVNFAEGVAGENTPDIIIESRDDDWLKYVTAGLGAVVLVLGVVVFRMGKEGD